MNGLPVSSYQSKWGFISTCEYIRRCGEREMKMEKQGCWKIFTSFPWEKPKWILSQKEIQSEKPNTNLTIHSWIPGGSKWEDSNLAQVLSFTCKITPEQDLLIELGEAAMGVWEHKTRFYSRRLNPRPEEEFWRKNSTLRRQRSFTCWKTITPFLSHNELRSWLPTEASLSFIATSLWSSELRATLWFTGFWSYETRPLRNFCLPSGFLHSKEWELWVRKGVCVRLFWKDSIQFRTP